MTTKARVGGAVEPAAERRRRVLDDLLEVVEDDQAAAAAGDRVAELHGGVVLAERDVEREATAKTMPSSVRASDRSQKQTPPGQSPSQVQP